MRRRMHHDVIDRFRDHWLTGVLGGAVYFRFPAGLRFMLLRCLPARSSTGARACTSVSGPRNAARLLTVGNRKKSVMERSAPSTSHTCPCTRTIRSECPPRSKKLSWTPTVVDPQHLLPHASDLPLNARARRDESTLRRGALSHG